MMKKMSTLMAVLMVFTFFGAQFASAELFGKDKDQQMQGAFRASKMMGETLKNQQGENLGKVEDVVLDQQGRFSYIILSLENDRFAPIPLSVMQPSTGKEGDFVANITKDQLQNAPTFSEGQWPELAGTEWTQRVYGYYGQQPGMQQPDMMQHQPGMQHPQMHQPGMQPRGEAK